MLIETLSHLAPVIITAGVIYLILMLINRYDSYSDADRWHGYYPGSLTTSFDTKEEIIELAKQCFKMRFTGDWELWIEDCTMAKTTVYQLDV